MDKLLAQLDAALAARRVLDAANCGTTLTLVTLWPAHDDQAEYALRIHASANGLGLVLRESHYPDGTRIRVIESILNGRPVAAVQFPREPIPVDGDAGSAWSPAHADKQLLEAR